MSAAGAGAASAPTPHYTKKDFESDQDVRWCPGCGDYAILSAVQKSMPDLCIPLENIVFISGIGCSSRFPYYMNTYGFHTIHGRAPAIATGLKVARPDLKVFVVTGDGDGLSICGNHMLHVLRRNVDITILDHESTYSRTQGEMVLKDFFAKNSVQSFDLLHRGTSGEGSSYGIGKLKTSTQTLRVYYFVKQKSSKSLLQELRFEKQK